jgi:hypothetical protein
MVSQAAFDAARTSGASSVGTIDVNNLGGGSLQLMFAKLQLTLAESAKSNATQYINDIQKTQGEQKQLAAMLQQARQLQTDANSKGETGSTDMPREMMDYMDDNGLAYDKTLNETAEMQAERKQLTAFLQDAQRQQTNAREGKGDASGDRYASMMSQEMQDYMDAQGLDYDKTGSVMVNGQIRPDRRHNQNEWEVAIASLQTRRDSLGPATFTNKKGEAVDAAMTRKEWEVAITSLQARMDSLGTDTQQKMVFVQDFMGQYNSYLQGANSVIQQSNQTLGELAKAR